MRLNGPTGPGGLGTVGCAAGIGKWGLTFVALPGARIVRYTRFIRVLLLILKLTFCAATASVLLYTIGFVIENCSNKMPYSHTFEGTHYPKFTKIIG